MGTKEWSLPVGEKKDLNIKDNDNAAALNKEITKKFCRYRLRQEDLYKKQRQLLINHSLTCQVRESIQSYRKLCAKIKTF